MEQPEEAAERHATASFAAQIRPKSSSKWSETVLYSAPNGKAGIFNGGLVLDAAGNLYGAAAGDGGLSQGTAFELSSDPGAWTFSVLYDAGFPGWLVMDGFSNLYGTYAPLEMCDEGGISELTPGGGGWTLNILYCFGSHQNDGVGPQDGLTWDAVGNLYATTSLGGSSSCQCGTVFELSPSSGGWQERVLYAFSSPLDGQYPYAGVAFDKSGNLYSATAQGGHSTSCRGGPCGTIFRLTPRSSGYWKKTVLYDFPNQTKDGSAPVSSPVVDQAGNIYGTAGGGIGPCNGGCGVVYKLSPRPHGKWNYTVLHKFNWTDGAFPNGGIILDGSGNLYGTTLNGGANGGGVLFKITP